MHNAGVGDVIRLAIDQPQLPARIHADADHSAIKVRTAVKQKLVGTLSGRIRTVDIDQFAFECKLAAIADTGRFTNQSELLV